MSTHPDHWLCAVGDTVSDPHYWHPPLGPDGLGSRRIVAFHSSLPRSGWTFERAALGELWTRTA